MGQQRLNGHQHIAYGEFLRKLEGGMSSEQYQKVKAVIDGWDIEKLVSAIDSVNFSAAEARVEPAKYIYYNLGLRDLLVEVELNDEERRKIINKIAGAEIAHPRGDVERD